MKIIQTIMIAKLLCLLIIIWQIIFLFNSS